MGPARSEEAHDEFGRLRFASAALAADENALVCPSSRNVEKSALGDLEDVRGQLAPRGLGVGSLNLLGVELDMLPWVQGQQYVAACGVNVVGEVPLPKSLEDVGLIEIGEAHNVRRILIGRCVSRTKLVRKNF